MNRFLQNYKVQRWRNQAKAFLQKSWYKLTLLALVAVIFTYKDLSIHLDLSSAASKQQVAPNLEDKFNMPTHPKPNTKQQFTDKLKKDSRTESFSLFPAFLFSNNRNTETLQLGLEKVDKGLVNNYVKKYAHVAVEEMKKYGVPASITLGQALLHGQAGTSILAENGNNHFSITCGSSWKKEALEVEGLCYRKYEGVWKSYRNHSELITKGRFKVLKKYSSTDYKQWAKGLGENGYSSVKGYGTLLIETIKKYNLDKYDE